MGWTPEDEIEHQQFLAALEDWKARGCDEKSLRKNALNQAGNVLKNFSPKEPPAPFNPLATSIPMPHQAPADFQEKADQKNQEALTQAVRQIGQELQDKATYLQSLVGRNEPCPCGSGKKFKKCCMRKEF